MALVRDIRVSPQLSLMDWIDRKPGLKKDPGILHPFNCKRKISVEQFLAFQGGPA